MAYQFKLIAGTHRSENKRYTKGNLIVSDVRLDQKFKNKFEFIGKVSNSQKAASTDSETIVKVDDNDSDETTIEKREKYILEKVGNRFNVLNTETEELMLEKNDTKKVCLAEIERLDSEPEDEESEESDEEDTDVTDEDEDDDWED